MLTICPYMRSLKSGNTFWEFFGVFIFYFFIFRNFWAVLVALLKNTKHNRVAPGINLHFCSESKIQVSLFRQGDSFFLSNSILKSFITCFIVPFVILFTKMCLFLIFDDFYIWRQFFDYTLESTLQLFQKFKLLLLT